MNLFFKLRSQWTVANDEAGNIDIPVKKIPYRRDEVLHAFLRMQPTSKRNDESPLTALRINLFNGRESPSIFFHCIGNNGDSILWNAKKIFGIVFCLFPNRNHWNVMHNPMSKFCPIRVRRMIHVHNLRICMNHPGKQDSHSMMALNNIDMPLTNNFC